MVRVDDLVGCRVDRLPCLIVGRDSTLVSCLPVYTLGLLVAP